jgi:hypothetical protein
MTGWQQLDADSNTVEIVADGNNLYQRHSTGAIFRYTGTPMTGWQQLDANPATTQIAAADGDLYQLHLGTGAVYRYTGTPITGWEAIDFDPTVTEIGTAQGMLYELLTTGAIWRYASTTWQLVGSPPTAGQPLAIGFAAAGFDLYKLGDNGAILRYHT